MYRIFLHVYFFLILGNVALTIVDVGLATPLGIQLISPFDLGNITNFEITNVYNVTNPNDTSTAVGKIFNPSNSTQGLGEFIGKITDYFQVSLEIIWYFFGLFTGTLIFQALAVFNVPDYIIYALAIPIGFLMILTLAHYLTGKG